MCYGAKRIAPWKSKVLPSLLWKEFKFQDQDSKNCYCAEDAGCAIFTGMNRCDVGRGSKESVESGKKE